MNTNPARHNFTVLTLDGLLFFLGMIFISLESVLPIFMSRLGASRMAIAVIPVAVALGVNLPSILAARMIEESPDKKRFVIAYGSMQRVPWAVIALLIPILAIPRPGLLVIALLVALAITASGAGVVIPAFFHIVSTTVPKNRRGRLFALRSVLSYLFGMGAGALVQVILRDIPYPLNYSVLYLIASVTLFAGLLAFSRLRDPEVSVAPQTERRPPIRTQITTILRSSRSFRYYILARAFLIIAFATTSFFPIYLVERFALPDSVSGLFAILTAATFVLVNPILGSLADRVGYKPVFIVSFLSLMSAAILGLLEIDQPFAYGLVPLIAISQSVNLFAWNMTMEFAPEGQVPTYISVSGLFLALVAPLGLLTGVVAIRFGFPGLFVLTGISAAIGLVIMWLGVEEPRVAQRRLNQPASPI
jgi:MFS family permease